MYKYLVVDGADGNGFGNTAVTMMVIVGSKLMIDCDENGGKR